MSSSAGKVLLRPRGTYDASATYLVLDWVLYQGKPYVAKDTTTGNLPTDTTHWQILLDFPTQFDNVPTENSTNLVNSGTVYTALAGKQNTLTFDSAPTSGSSNPVTSGGVHTALSGKQNTLTFDNAPTQNSDNPVKSGGVYTALGNKQDTLTFDNSPTQNSNNPVKSGGVYSALAGKQNSLTFDNAPTQSSDNPVKSGGVYSALAGKQDNLTFDNAPTQNSSNPVTSDGIYTALQNAGGGDVDQTETTTDADYEVLFSGTADNTDRREGARKSRRLKYNPDQGLLKTRSLTVGDCTASGNYSFAAGNNTKATGIYSVAMGQSSQATSQETFAFGQNASATAFGSIAFFGSAPRSKQFVYDGGYVKKYTSSNGGDSCVFGFENKCVSISSDTSITNGTAGCSGQILTANTTVKITLGQICAYLLVVTRQTGIGASNFATSLHYIASPISGTPTKTDLVSGNTATVTVASGMLLKIATGSNAFVHFSLIRLF